MRSSNDRIVKGYVTTRFEVDLFQDEDGRYYVRYCDHTKDYDYSEYVTDFGTASYMFDLKVKEMEGN